MVRPYNGHEACSYTLVGKSIFFFFFFITFSGIGQKRSVEDSLGGDMKV